MCTEVIMYVIEIYWISFLGIQIVYLIRTQIDLKTHEIKRGWDLWKKNKDEKLNAQFRK